MNLTPLPVTLTRWPTPSGVLSIELWQGRFAVNIFPEGDGEPQQIILEPFAAHLIGSLLVAAVAVLEKTLDKEVQPR